MNAIGANFSHRFFIARVAAVFGIVALMLFSLSATVRAQEVADEEEIVFEEEEVVAEDESASAEAPADADALAGETADEGGFFDAIGDFFGDVTDAVVDTVTDAYDTATDFLGLGDDDETVSEEVEIPTPIEQTAPAVPEDTDVTAPVTAPKTNPFALRVRIAATDVAAVLRSARGPEPIRYEPRAFDIPERGRLMLRAEQDGPLFCLVFDISEFRTAAALTDALFEVNGARNAAEKGDVNTVCVGLPGLSANAPLAIEAVFK